MKISMVLLVSLFVALLCATGEVAAVDLDPHLVHFGDIKLVPCTDDPSCQTKNSMIGTLMVYYGDNYRAPEWRPVCKESFSDHHNQGSTAICNIVGYKEGEELNKFTGLLSHRLQAAHFVTSTDYALTDLDCTNTLSNGAPPNHLLRCGKFSPYKKKSPCAGPLILSCSSPKGYPLPNSKSAYEGQVQLCPPDQLNGTSPATQVSMGIVTVLGNSYWGSLNDNNSARIVNYQQASSVCRQMGFTGAVANSVRTVQSYSGQYSFTKCQHPAYSSLFGLQRIWLTVEQSQLCTSSSPCFSCCYNHPSDGGQCHIASLSNGECPKGHCCIENDVVIECTFDQTSTLNEPPAAESGSETICGFHGSQSILFSAPCSQQVPEYTQEQFLIGVLVPAIAFFVLLTFLVILGVACVCKRRNRCGYGPVPGQDRNHENSGNHD